MLAFAFILASMLLLCAGILAFIVVCFVRVRVRVCATYMCSGTRPPQGSPEDATSKGSPEEVVSMEGAATSTNKSMEGTATCSNKASIV